MRSIRIRVGVALVCLLSAGFPLATASQRALAEPNPVATDEGTYQAFGRVFPDPQGCEAYAVPDANGDGIKDTPRGISPWAKGRVCADQFLQYQEVIEGAQFLARRFPDLLQVIRLDQAYDNPNYMSAGIPRNVVTEDGKVKTLGRDRRPLYMFRVTDAGSPVPYADRKHFAYTMSIHGIERAGVEGGTRAMEDLVTWAACEKAKYAQPALPALPPPACGVEGPFPKKIVETPTSYPVPTAGDVLRNSVIYFVLPNPDGWARGQVSPVEMEDGSPNTNYTPGFFFQRYNGNGVDLNRDWPTKGYTYRPYSPASEPEVKAFGAVLRQIRDATTDGRFAGGIDLHGMYTAYAFSYTLLGSGQRDYRKNALTVDTSIRTWQDQTRRESWSPYIADANANGTPDGTTELCPTDTVGSLVFGSGTRPRMPACVADQWGTVIDTIGYQVSGALGDWMDSPLGLDAVGIDNEMFVSHLVPNIVFEPALEQTHIDGNKGLIFSQISSLLTAGDVRFHPGGKVGYVYNPNRLRVPASARPENPGLPAQNDIDALIPCQSAGPQNLDAEVPCGDGTFVMSGASPTFEFNVKGPAQGIWNGGLTVTTTKPNAAGISDGNVSGIQLQYFDEGSWHTAASDFNQSFLYLQAGATITANDPQPGRWRVVFSPLSVYPLRLRIDFSRVTSEASPGQTEIDASSMDFFDELNAYVPAGEKLQPVGIQDVVDGTGSVAGFDSLIVVNNLGKRSYLTSQLGLSAADANEYFANLKRFAERGGNLVLTDAALSILPEMGLVASNKVASSSALVGNYNFQIAAGNVTYTNPTRYPLAAGVNKPGAAEQTTGRRQAVEPTPIGYTPDPGLDSTPQMPFWGVDKTAWQAACGQPDCSVAATAQNGSSINLGEARLGKGRVRIAGIMFPDPMYQPDAANDYRFGLSDYALTYTAYQVFENLLNYQAPEPVADLSVSASASPEPVIVGDDLTYSVEVANAGPDPATAVRVTVALPSGVTFRSASDGCAESGGTVVCDLGGLEPGEAVDVAIVVTAEEPGQLTSRVMVEGAEADADPANNAVSVSSTSACTITGTAGDDTLVGTPGRDVMCGLGGADTIRGLDGNDLILGGDGADRIYGGNGDDVLRGGAGDDDLKGAEGNDTLSGGAGFDTLNGGPGTDACSVDEGGGKATDCE